MGIFKMHEIPTAGFYLVLGGIGVSAVLGFVGIAITPAIGTSMIHTAWGKINGR